MTSRPRKQPYEWYMYSAIVAHEEVHAAGWQTLTSANYAILKPKAEALTVDMSCEINTADKAKAAILALPAYQAARSQFNAACIADWAQYSHPAITAETIAAEQVILNPVYLGIIAKAAENGWP